MADNDSNSIGWFLAGLGLGALVGVLYAPKSGRETRETILQSAIERLSATGQLRASQELTSIPARAGRLTWSD